MYRVHLVWKWIQELGTYMCTQYTHFILKKKTQTVPAAYFSLKQMLPKVEATTFLY